MTDIVEIPVNEKPSIKIPRVDELGIFNLVGGERPETILVQSMRVFVIFDPSNSFANPDFNNAIEITSDRFIVEDKGIINGWHNYEARVDYDGYKDLIGTGEEGLPDGSALIIMVLSFGLVDEMHFLHMLAETPNYDFSSVFRERDPNIEILQDITKFVVEADKKTKERPLVTGQFGYK